MKILVTGSKGQLGSDLMLHGKESGHEMTGFDLPELDISDEQKVKEIISANDYEMVINAAAYTAVDLAETENEKAEMINGKAPGYIAKACSDKKTPLIHVSTDYVFDGTKTDPYTENDLPKPLGVYGLTKLNGELAVAKSLVRHVIVRTAWVYGTNGKNFVKTMLLLGKERDELRVVCDQQGCPTYSLDLAMALLKAAERIHENPSDNLWGIYHFCGKGKVSWHGFAEAIFEEARKFDDFRVEKIHAITTAEYPTPAKRPANSVLACDKFSMGFGVLIPEWRDSLRNMIRRLYS